MPRKGFIRHRSVPADATYNSALVQKFVNCLMYDGERSVAENIFYGAMDKIQERSGEESLKVFKKALDNARPVMEVKTRRVGGANYQIPVEVSSDRRTSLGIRWLIGYARHRGEKGMVERLSAELLDAYHGRGGAIKKKEDTHRMAEANRAIAHYRW
ncbi:MAG: 30S ribosomal protein S7 [Acidobacteria bacterium]|nr:30S ribosomal protein S7 [Acidobacteriota bacterium]